MSTVKEPTYKVWNPLDNVKFCVNCESLVDDRNGLCILLKSKDTDGTLYRLLFHAYLAYRNSDEGARLRTLEKKVISPNNSLYIVTDSDFIRWHSEESFGTSDRLHVIHVSIVTDNDWIDVLTEELPEIQQI